MNAANRMKWQGLLILLLLTVFSKAGFSQFLYRKVMNTAGTTVTNGYLMMTTSVGESNVKRFQTTGIVWYEGFLQPFPMLDRPLPTGLYETTSANQFIVYPNPAAEELTIQAITTNLTFSVTDMFGQKVSEGLLENNHISLASMAPGIYYIQLTTADGHIVYSTKIIKI